jgi:hypothetical protein
MGENRYSGTNYSGKLAFREKTMAPEELRDVLRHQPFEPFRMVMTDGVAYDIPHPDLLMVGRRSAVVGLTGPASQTLYERTIKIDLLHIIRIEPLQTSANPGPNGSN